MGNNIITTIYYILVVACVLISTYLSYFGYISSFGDLALPFTLVIGVGLFGADALIQRARVTGRSLIAPFLLFLLFAFFSGASNFNFLYTTFMEKDVLVQALDSQYARLRDNLASTRDRLLRLESYTFTERQRVDLDRELARLRDQIFDDLRPGCGERCRDHLGNIEGILGEPMTELAIPPPGSRRDLVEGWYERVSASARADFEKLTEATQYPGVAGLVREIDSLLLQYDTPDRALAQNTGLSVLRTMAEANDEVERQANTLLPEDQSVTHPDIDVTLGRLGEIAYSFQNAFVEMPNPAATFISALLSVVIDIFPVVFALVAFSPDPGRVYKPTGRRGRAGTILE